MSIDAYDRLVESCRRWPEYPCHLQLPNQPKSASGDHRLHLHQSERKLFNANRENISIIEPNYGLEKYHETIINRPSDLKPHLLQNRKDPHYCIIFIQSKDSRSPLDCSRESFSYLATFHQISGSFVDLVSAFSYSKEPTHYHMTGFEGRDTLDSPKHSISEISKLGRSGREHTVQYLLRSVEKSTGPMGGAIWNIRQMAVYHKYDFVTGRAFWLSIKSNSLMQERIKQAIVDDPALRPAAADDLCGSFSATLLTHLIHLEWCDEAWLECITDFEKKIRKKLTIAKAARLDQPTNFQESALRKALRKNSNLSGSTVSGTPTEESLKGWPQQKQGFWRPLTSCFRTASQSRSPPPILPVASEKQGIAQSEACDGFAKQLYSLMVLGTFSFDEVQDLHHLGEQLESYRLVIQVNRQTLRDILEHYQDVVSRSSFAPKMKKNSKRDLASFTRRVERIQKNLELRLTQVESLLAWLQEGKALFDGILQYRSVQVSHIFTESSHIQSEKMERIAHKTEQETISMHVVTCVTLAFLPGTFVAAFFQSGLIEINKASNDIDGSVIFHPGAFKLFTVICFPLMFITFALWFIVFKVLARKARKQESQESV